MDTGQVLIYHLLALSNCVVTPLYIAKHRLRSGKQVLTVRTTQKRGIAALDLFNKRIERSAGNNSLKIAALPITGASLSH